MDTYGKRKAVVLQILWQNQNRVETAAGLNVAQHFVDWNLVVGEQQIDADAQLLQLPFDVLGVVAGNLIYFKLLNFV